jgi:hypothetical protein
MAALERAFQRKLEGYYLLFLWYRRGGLRRLAAFVLGSPIAASGD